VLLRGGALAASDTLRTREAVAAGGGAAQPTGSRPALRGGGCDARHLRMQPIVTVGSWRDGAVLRIRVIDAARIVCASG
jgi:hypothetical protein